MAEHEEVAELEEIEAGVRALAFDRDPDFARLAVDDEIQRVYRGLVRGSVSSVLRSAVPVLRAVWGADATDDLIARFLDGSGPTTRLYRAIPFEFAAWVQAQDEVPAAARELVHFEVTRLEVTQAPDPTPDPARREHPDDDLAVEFCPSARLLAYAHPVHSLPADAEALPAPSRAPNLLLAHRAAEKMRWLRLPPTVAQLLVLSAELSIGPAIEAVREGLGADPPFLRSWLVNLRGRGAILGFYAPEGPPEEER